MKKLWLLLFAIAWIGASAATPTVATPTHIGVSDQFRNYARANASKMVNGQIPNDDVTEQEKEVPNHFYLPRGKGMGAMAKVGMNAVTAPSSNMTNQTANGVLPVDKITDYAGLGNDFPGWVYQGLYPPDTTMAVGNNQIVQWVNIRLTVLNKTTGLPLLPAPGYISGNQIWSGLGPTSLCATTNRGDPVLQYDRLAGRWFLAQFAFNGTFSQNSMCFAVSQTNDASGAWNLYEYGTGNRLPDYPKIGVWPDAYYWTANDYPNGGNYGGSRVCALDRAAMIAGAASPVELCYTGLGAQFFASLPADFEGNNAPPPNAHEYILSIDWFTLNFPPYTYDLRRFHPDFVTPANSTFDDGFGGAPLSFAAMPMSTNVIGACGDNGGKCVTQPGTTQGLDSLSMRPMYRLAYRNVGPYDTLVYTDTNDPAGAAVAGIQLLEIRNPSSNPPTIYNNVNLNPTADNRWMGAAATDKLGNVLYGYSVSSSSVSPSINIAGRLRNDLRSTVRGEIRVLTGTGNQTGTAGRWGDYSTMQIDPDDDCTFWYTQEFTNQSSGANWATHIFAYKFKNCQ